MLKVLSARGAEGEEWSRRIAGLPAELRDIHYLPEYGRIYGDAYGFEPCLALFQATEGYVLQPFVRRPLGGLEFLAGSGEAASDIANPYGYGGPLCSAGASPALYARFAEEFARWCEREAIASEFASLHPFFAAHQLALVEGRLATRHEKDVVYVDLAGGESELLAGLNRGHRSSVAKARRAGVRVEQAAPTPANLALFGEIYHATMVRRNAAARWFLPERFFADTVRQLGPKRTSLFFARVGAEVEVAYLLMHDFATAYYHFAGTRDRHPELRANNLLMLETADWARRAGYRRYHLGGGVTSSDRDSLLRFKAGFSRRRAPLHTYFCVRNQVVYDRLCERKRAHERAVAGRESTSDFLPLYRR